MAEDVVDPTNRTHAFLIGRHHFGTRSPTGCGTKGFIAYDIDRNRLSFMKDYWYAVRETVHPEAEVYKKLNATEVRFAATLVAGGDIADCAEIGRAHV